MPEQLFQTLDDVEDWCLGQLARAAHDRKSPFRWPVLATASPEGGAGARILVLRDFDRDTPSFEVWSDGRSDKVAALQADPSCELHFFDAGRMVQLRAACSARLVRSGRGWEASFSRARQAGLSDYASLMAPGEVIDTPEAERDPSLAERHFVRIELRLKSLDALCLSREGHRRARLDWTEQTVSAPSRSWIVA